MSELRVHYPSLDKLFAAMNEIDEGGTQINAYVGAEVCNAGGFGHTAMGPIAEALPIIKGAFDDGMNGFHGKWNHVQRALYNLADDMKKHDQDVAAELKNYAGAGARCVANEPYYTAVFDFDPVAPALTAPEPGADQLAHPRQFEDVGALWDEVKGAINGTVDKINGFGLIQLPKLPEESLQEMLVFPLAGNYKKIGADANACTVVDTAMGIWGDNFTKLATRTPLAITGASGAALAAEFTAYGRVMSAVGDAVGKGSRVFEAIAKVAERLAVAIEKNLVKLGDALISLGKEITEHTRPVLGWLKTGWDAVHENIHMFDKIIAEIKFVIGVIDKVKSLKSDIESWAQSAREDLQNFKDVATAMAKLPSATVGGHTSTRREDARSLAKTLDDITFGTAGAEDTSSLDQQLDEDGNPREPAPAATAPAGPAGPGGVQDGTVHSGGVDPDAGPEPAGAPPGSAVA